MTCVAFHVALDVKRFYVLNSNKIMGAFIVPCKLREVCFFFAIYNLAFSRTIWFYLMLNRLCGGCVCTHLNLCLHFFLFDDGEPSACFSFMNGVALLHFDILVSSHR